MRASVLVHIVTFNHERCIRLCLEHLVTLLGLSRDVDLEVQITDNASSDRTWEIIESVGPRGIRRFRNAENLGFCGGHNQGVRRFLDGSYTHLLVLNPDVRIEPGAIEYMIGALSRDRTYGLATPKLFRADETLSPHASGVLDAAGMHLASSLRHFDRGSGELDRFFSEEIVFGGTGACLMMTRSCVEALLLEAPICERDVDRIYPQLRNEVSQRAPLFDEAFFAYREDADLSWRARLLGWRCVFVPRAIGYHTRVVLPENRSALPSEYNRWSVRNRFLLQLNNLTVGDLIWALIPGIIIRNGIVVLGVLFMERSSLGALADLWRLLPRALERRRIVMRRRDGA